MEFWNSLGNAWIVNSKQTNLNLPRVMFIDFWPCHCKKCTFIEKRQPRYYFYLAACKERFNPGNELGKSVKCRTQNHQSIERGHKSLMLSTFAPLKPIINVDLLKNTVINRWLYWAEKFWKREGWRGKSGTLVKRNIFIKIGEGKIAESFG